MKMLFLEEERISRIPPMCQIIQNYYSQEGPELFSINSLYSGQASAKISAQ